MAITNPGASDKLDAALAKGQNILYSKVGTNMKSSGSYHSFWRATGNPVAGTVPTAPAIPTRTTQGAIPLTAFGSDTGYFSIASMFSTVAGTFHLADRLWHTSGLNANITTVQPIPNLNVTRNLTGSNLLFVEHYAPTGNTASNITVNYTNLANQARSATIALATLSVAGQMQPVPINDTGVLSIQSVQLSASSGVVGDFGLTIVNLIDMVFINSAFSGSKLGIPDTGLPVIDPDACLFGYWGALGTTSAVLTGKTLFAMG